ncbi:hypothetical protein TrVGV298_007721 [Trichoderma virens]|nr:hypothetical protein TrVGV298_007721 [Trichoderma virens]
MDEGIAVWGPPIWQSRFPSCDFTQSALRSQLVNRRRTLNNRLPQTTPAIAASTTAQQPAEDKGAPLQQHQWPSSDTPSLRCARSTPPGGWLWGIKPGEKPEPEGWEWPMYLFGASLLVTGVALAFKPDTSVSTWALEEARRRLEAEGVLPDPSNQEKKN